MIIYRTRDLTKDTIVMNFAKTQTYIAQKTLSLLRKENRLLRRKGEKQFNYKVTVCN